MAKLGPFGLIPETEDFLEEELRDLRLKWSIRKNGKRRNVKGKRLQR